MSNRTNASAFQGKLTKKSYFEGYYNKIVDKKQKNIFTFIPGIALNSKENSSHAFIQILNGKTGKAEYFRYPIDEFKNLSDKYYHISIANNTFSSNGIKININRKDKGFYANIKYSDLVPWPRKFLQPGVMGFFSYIPFMETYHGIVSMNHNTYGVLNINKKEIDYNQGKGYIEKDWGISFPSSWIWMQSNHFSDPQLSFMFSIAKIPFLRANFNGFLSALWHEGKFFKFATYTMAKVRSLNIDAEKVIINIEDSKYILHIIARKNKAHFGDLKAPSQGVMSGRIAESINSKIRLKLYDKKIRKYLIDDVGFNAGLEVKNANLFIK